jgi:pyrroloquinoline quinone biosynthesis protein B
MHIPANQVTAVILGIMQDGGLPHIGCHCSRCLAAFRDPAQMAYAACMAIVDKRPSTTRTWLIDATPDIKWQLQLLAKELGPHSQRRGRIGPPDGIFLTHPHMGHLGGLPQLGPEAMAVQNFPVYATAGLVSLLQSTRLWQPVISGLDLKPVAINELILLGPDLVIEPLPVPHRDEWEVGTVAYRIHGPHKSLLYLPDIDSWAEWPEAQATLSTVDFALVDASFYSTAELGGRDPVAHPLIPDTLRRFASIPGQLILTHLNHTNPVLDQNSHERKSVLEAGAIVARRGMTLQL